MTSTTLLTTRIEIINERRLRVARLGSGQPLILLHGYPDNLQIWCELAPRLATRFEVIALDWPGMGESEAWPGGTTPQHMADRLRELLDALKLKRAAIAAMDMGAQPALVFAAKYPDRIHSLVVMNSLVMWDARTSWEIELLRKFGWNRIILQTLPALVFRRAEKTFLPPGQRLPAELRADLWHSFKRPEVRKFIVRLCAGYQGTLARLPEFYAQITCPTLVLWGDRDKHFHVEHAQRLQAAIAGSKLELVAGGEHWMAWHRAAEICERILAFHSLLGHFNSFKR